MSEIESGSDPNDETRYTEYDYDLSIEQLTPGDLISTELIASTLYELAWPKNKPPSYIDSPPLVSVSEYPLDSGMTETDELLCRQGEPGVVLVTIREEWAEVVGFGNLRVDNIIDIDGERADDIDENEIRDWIPMTIFEHGLSRVAVDGRQITVESHDQSLRVVAEISLEE